MRHPRAASRQDRLDYGARSVSDLVYRRELEEREARKDVKVWQTADPGGETPAWKA
jgi:hypothetical protein